jgi:multiple sugar transport system substrate-binding protein
MKRFVERALALALSVCMVISLAACSSSSSVSSDASNSTAKNTSSQLDKNASLTLKILNWGSTSEEKICNDAIARFNKVYPNIKVQQTCVPVTEWSDFIQKWTTMITSGDAPDVINYGLEATRMAVKNNLLYKLDDVVSSDPTLSSSKGNYAKSLINGFTVNGRW